MKDFLGNELNVGDKVVFIYSNGTGHRLMAGEIEEIKRGMAYIKGMKYASYDWDPRDLNRGWGDQVKVKSSSIYKIDENPMMGGYRKLFDLELEPNDKETGKIEYLDYKI